MDLLDLLFPKNCLGCGRSGGYVCPMCLKFAHKQWLICPKCRKLSPTGQVHISCKTKYGLNGLISLYKYQGVIKKLITKLKYGFASDIAATLTNICLTSLLSTPFFKSPILIPIPLYSARRRWRGFNQTEIIAENIANKLNWNYQPQLLTRISFTHTQVGLEKAKRMRNTCGEFAVNATILATLNKSNIVILFDDVWTTGSTIVEACKTLKKAGFGNVWGLTIAR